MIDPELLQQARLWRCREIDLTQFGILSQLLGSLRSPADLWELMSACFNHLRLVLENTDFSMGVVKASNQKLQDRPHPPGYSIMDDILGEADASRFGLEKVTRTCL